MWRNKRRGVDEVTCKKYDFPRFTYCVRKQDFLTKGDMDTNNGVTDEGSKRVIFAWSVLEELKQIINGEKTICLNK